MFAMPDAAQLVELAATLNLRLSPAEAELYVPVIHDAMRELDTFVQSRAEEAAPPLLFPERGPGHPAAALRLEGHAAGLKAPLQHRSHPAGSGRRPRRGGPDLVAHALGTHPGLGQGSQDRFEDDQCQG